MFPDFPQKGIETRELPPYSDNPNIGDKGWRKLSLFNRELADLKGTALFLDLDIVIRQSLDPFFEAEGEFLIVKDWDFPKDIIGNSSVFRFEVGKYPEVLENFYKLGNEIRNDYKNEQAFLSYQMYEKGILKYWEPDWCVSFKRNCLQPFPLNFFKMPNDPENAKIIVFHGRPTPEQARAGYNGKGFHGTTPLEIFEEVLKHEQFVTSSINHVADVAEEVKDRAALHLLDWYIKEQVEEESNVGGMLATLRLIGDDKKALLMLDKDLAARTFVQPVIG